MQPPGMQYPSGVILRVVVEEEWVKACMLRYGDISPEAIGSVVFPKIDTMVYTLTQRAAYAQWVHVAY